MAVHGLWACKWGFWEADGKALKGGRRTPPLLTLYGLQGHDCHGVPLHAQSAPRMETALMRIPAFQKRRPKGSHVLYPSLAWLSEHYA